MKPTQAMLAAALCLLSVQAQEPRRPRITGVAHMAIYAHDVDAALRFYCGFLGFEEISPLKQPDGSLFLTFIKINDRQYIELFPEREAGSQRMGHISFETEDVEAMRVYLAAKGVEVPPKVGVGRAGAINFTVKDPDGVGVEFAQYPENSVFARLRGRSMPASRVSEHVSHLGILVSSLSRSMAFYRDILGFSETWRGSRDGKTLSWVNAKVPDGDDYIELMLYSGDAPPPAERGTSDHLCLVVSDIEKTKAALEARPGRKDYTRPLEIRTGINRKRQMNLYDPDGTRTEVMEPRTIDGAAAPSSTAPAPR